MSGRRIVITGASSGLGAALAIEMLHRGWRVALLARRENPLREIVQAHDPSGQRSLVYAVDVQDHGKLGEILGDVAIRWEGLDAVVANAGIGIPASALQTTPDALRQTLDVNVIAAWETLRLGFPHVRNSRHGVLAAVSSMAAWRGGPGAAAYAASKSALSALLQAARPEIESTGVRLLEINPGFVRTPMTDRNRFSMPFLVEAPKAAQHMARAIERRRRRLAFPWPMTLALGSVRRLPDSVFDFLNRRLYRGLVRKGQFPPGA